MTSDISGKDITDEEHARLVITDHPSLRGNAVELDLSVAEAEKLQTTKIDLVTAEIYEPNKPKRHVVLDASAFASAFKGVDMDELISNARRTATSSTSSSRRSTSTRGSRSGEKVDYTAPDRFGQLHRGRVTEEEAAMVRGDKDQASKNRQSQGHPPIDFSDPKEVKRYGL